MGNFDSKLSPYYAIVDENGPATANYSHQLSSSLSGAGKIDPHTFNPHNLSLWTIRRVNFSNEQNKNSTLFEFNSGKFAVDLRRPSARHMQLALNQIRQLKKIRHPNIVKYHYSEEPSAVAAASASTATDAVYSLAHSKCLLITESVRPLRSVIGGLGRQQVVRGLYGVTSALCFLHERVALSHNNVGDWCVYVSSQQAWKLNDFELAVSFERLDAAALLRLHEFKCRSAITPEEELQHLASEQPQAVGTHRSPPTPTDYRRCPHAVDAYAWAMLLIGLLSAGRSNSNNSNSSKKTPNATAAAAAAAAKQKRIMGGRSLFNGSFTSSSKANSSTAANVSAGGGGSGSAAVTDDDCETIICNNHKSNGDVDVDAPADSRGEDATPGAKTTPPTSNKAIKHIGIFGGDNEGHDDAADDNDDDDEDEEEVLECVYDEVEAFLSNEPTMRPKLSDALQMRLFDLYRNNGEMRHSPSVVKNAVSAYNLASSDVGDIGTVNGGVDGSRADEASSAAFDVLKIDNLTDLAAHWPELIDYLASASAAASTSTSSKRASPSPSTAFARSKSGNQTKQQQQPQPPTAAINEQLVEFLFAPFMFFSAQVRAIIFPNVFVAREEHATRQKRLETLTRTTGATTTTATCNDRVVNYFLYHNCLSNPQLLDSLNSGVDSCSPPTTDHTAAIVGHQRLTPFISLDKYKALVVPRIIQLFGMHSTQIRIVLLEYFAFYVAHINDTDTLRDEILPELLLGLKDTNRQLVSLTFSCLSLMVQYLGAEVVVGIQATTGHRYFSDNVPKRALSTSTTSNTAAAPATVNANSRGVAAGAAAAAAVVAINNNRASAFKTSSSTASLNGSSIDGAGAAGRSAGGVGGGDGGEGDGDTSVANRLLHSGYQTRVFSDSMIALHDDQENEDAANNSSRRSSSSSSRVAPTGRERDNYDNASTKQAPHHQNSDIDDDDDDEDMWSNDFGWGNSNNSVNNFSSSELSSGAIGVGGAPQSRTIAGANAEPVSLSSVATSSAWPARTSVAVSDQMGAEFDVKSINVIKKSQPKSPKDDLIDSFLHEMQPVMNRNNNESLSLASVSSLARGSGGGVETQSLMLSAATTTAASECQQKHHVMPTTTAVTVVTKSQGGTSNGTWECEDDVDLNLDDEMAL